MDNKNNAIISTTSNPAILSSAIAVLLTGIINISLKQSEFKEILFLLIPAGSVIASHIIAYFIASYLPYSAEEKLLLSRLEKRQKTINKLLENSDNYHLDSIAISKLKKDSCSIAIEISQIGKATTQISVKQS